MTTSATSLKQTCVECEKQFLVIPQEQELYAKNSLPTPDQCPQCRHRQRLALRSERKLYQRNCGKCQQSMLSIYPPEAPYLVYCQKCFWENIG